MDEKEREKYQFYFLLHFLYHHHHHCCSHLVKRETESPQCLFSFSFKYLMRFHAKLNSFSAFMRTNLYNLVNYSCLPDDEELTKWN